MPLVIKVDLEIGIVQYLKKNDLDKLRAYLDAHIKNTKKL